ncbi:MAG: hypothetical protein Q8896_13450, partial [Bacteroidota bacterium]|nr:hypothetical protein [Bacteroidota bacterium]
EEAEKLKPDYLVTLSNLARACWLAKNEEKQRRWAEYAIPAFEKRLRLFPDEEWAKVEYAMLLYHTGRDEDAKRFARQLDTLRDGRLLYNASWVHRMLDDYESSVTVFCKAMEAGFRDLPLLRSFLEEGLAKIKGTPKWEAAREIVEKLEAEQTSKNNG